MNTAEFVARLREQDIQISAEGGALRVNARRGSLTPELRSEISGRKSELIEFLQRTASDGPAAKWRPMTARQEHIWLDQSLHADDCSHHLAFTVRLRGRLDPDLLCKCVQRAIAAHGVFRLRFSKIDGVPQCAEMSKVLLPAPVIDLTSAVDLERELSRQLATHSRKIFHLASEPALRTALFRVADECHVLLLVLHEIVADRRSLAIILRDAALLYNSLNASEREYVVPAVEWRQEDSAEPAKAEDYEYWENNFAKVPPLDISSPESALAGPERQGAATIFRLNSPHHPRPDEVVCIAAFFALLHRHSRQTTLAIEVSDTSAADALDAPGQTPTLLLRTALPDDHDTEEFLHRVRLALKEAQDRMSLEKAERHFMTLSPEMIFPEVQNAFEFVSEHVAPAPAFAGLDCTVAQVDTGSARYDLKFIVMVTPQSVELRIQYATARFSRNAIRRLARHYKNVLRSLSDEPTGRVSELPLITAAETDLLLHRWNDTAVKYPQGDVLQMFQEQVRAHPEATAVIFGDRIMTYADLDRRTTALADFLGRRTAGQANEQRAGICVTRTDDIAVAILGVMKAGAAFIPLDPFYPTQRLATIREDAELSVIITSTGVELSSWAGQVPLARLDELGEGNCDRYQPQLDPRQLAYIMYTSGSTGKPKGVEITHDTFANVIRAFGVLTDMGPNDTLLAVATISCDMACLDVLLPLTRGARLVIAGSEDIVNGQRLSSLILQHRVTFLEATPATWRLLMFTGESWPHLKMYCGGEAADPILLGNLIPRGAGLWNVYGPTETTIWSTGTEIREKRQLVPLGRPIANTTIYLLDDRGALVPFGVPGEIFIGGPVLARSYFRRSALTAERFVPDPFASQPGARMYRTGDLAKRLENGEVVFLGRNDNQIKIRGFRVELGEIEACLNRHEAVTEAAVIKREDRLGDARLVAYVTLQENRQTTGEELRAWIKQSLPAHMIPSSFMILQYMPRTPNGKTDRNALPPPADVFEPQVGEALGNMEQLVTTLWQEQLGVSQIALDDNFFDLGGHSLLLPRLHLRLQQHLGKDFPLIDLFKYTTVESQAQYLRERCLETPTLVMGPATLSA